MMDMTTLWMFAGSVLLLMLSPGPNMAFVLTQGAAHGWRGGLACGVGIGMADLILTALTVTGITTLLSHWPASFELIRYAGVAYLLWLAFKAVQSSAVSGHGTPQTSLLAVSVRALLNSLLNPKALLFFMVFLPQFVQPGSTPVAAQLLILGIILTLLSAVFHSTLGAFAGVLRRTFSPASPFARWQARGLALVLALLAARLACLPLPV